MLACSFVGTPDTVRQGLQAFIAETGADELMVASAIWDHNARLRSYELLSQVQPALASTPEDVTARAA